MQEAQELMEIAKNLNSVISKMKKILVKRKLKIQKNIVHSVYQKVNKNIKTSCSNSQPSTSKD